VDGRIAGGGEIAVYLLCDSGEIKPTYIEKARAVIRPVRAGGEGGVFAQPVAAIK
jgi:hypothetical protein